MSACVQSGLNMLDLCKRDGSLRCVLVLDGDASMAVAVQPAVVRARCRAAATCYRCGAPGHLRLAWAGWPATQCDARPFKGRLP